jgi:hypothetical protein
VCNGRDQHNFPFVKYDDIKSNAQNHVFQRSQIIKTLIGQKIGGVFDGWTFDSPQEFVSFNIVSVANPSNVRTDYEVKAHLKGIPSGEERDVDLLLTYGWLYTHWKLVGIQQLQ